MLSEALSHRPALQNISLSCSLSHLHPPHPPLAWDPSTSLALVHLYHRPLDVAIVLGDHLRNARYPQTLGEPIVSTARHEACPNAPSLASISIL